MSRPLIYVLAGVNGAGKSSLGGRALAQSGLAWFNPAAYARDSSLSNLIALKPGAPVPDPRLLLQMEGQGITSPTGIDTLRAMPDWAKPIMEAALRLQR